ncbi:MAG: PD-(D/E)XK nuclease family protein [Elusimicrobia bacterium]|nr:PD-(D/E)XK nuclease family protein [Elusimicrobiota bacterium]
MKKPKKTEDPAPGLFGAASTSAPEPQKRSKCFFSFSYSKMALYEECPLKYKFKYVDKIKEEPKYYFAFGHSIHHALEFLYAVKAPPFPAVGEVLEAFRKDWNLKSCLEKGYKDPAKADGDYQKGLEMLSAYYRHHDGRFKLPFLLEYGADVEVDGMVVRIIADKIEYLGKGELALVDYKTGKDVRRRPDQLHMYQKICELDPRLRERVHEVYGDKVPVLRIKQMLYYHVPTLKEYAFDRAEDAEIGVFWERALGVAENIRAARFDPSPGERQCAWCDYKKLCPHFCGGEERRPAAAPEAEAVGELVDSYGRLREKLDEMSARAEELKARIISLADGAEVLAGKEYELNIKRVEKTEFRNREAVIAALNEFDLYQKALGLTIKNITALMSDPSVPEAAREKLLRLAGKSRVFDLIPRKKT